MIKRFISLLIFISLLLQNVPAYAQSNTDWLEAYRQPGERVITLAQGLKYNGQTYRIHYFTTGDLNIKDSYFIARASPQFFKNQKVTAILVSSNNEVVTDEDVIEQVLLRYRAAHYLYIEQNEPLFYDPAGVAKEMRRFTNLPVFLQFWERLVKHKLFGTKDEEYAEAMRGILSTQLGLPSDLQSAADDVVLMADQYSTMTEAIESAKVTNDLLSRSRRVRRNAKDWEKAFESWHKTVDGSQYVNLAGENIELFNALDLFEITTKLIWITNLQKDRSAELNSFHDHADGEAAFDPDMMRAYSVVSGEVDNAWSQRYHIMLDFIGEHSFDLGERLTAEALARLLVKKSGSFLRISYYAWGHAISLGSIGYLLGDLLFGIDDTYHNFQIGVRTDELRQKFQAWRLSLLERTRNQSVATFDGDLAEQYRSAYLLEAYASARVYRYYADGVEASARSGIIDPIKRLFGQEYSKAGDALRLVGIKIEADAEEALGYPSFLEEAGRLSRNRVLLVSLTVDDSFPGFHREGKADFWTHLPAGYAGQAEWTYNETETVNSGAWELVLNETGRYLVQVYLPAPTGDLKKPYSASVKYRIAHAEGTDEVLVDQAGQNGKWIDLGVYEFAAGQKAVVTLNDQTSEPPGDALVVFDAVRFIPETQMGELLDGEPFNLDHLWQQLQDEVGNWLEDTASGIQQAVSQWWQDQQQKIEDSFDEWWQGLQQQIEDAVNRWVEQQLKQLLNQCLPSAFLPFGAAAVVLVSRRRRRIKRG